MAALETQARTRDEDAQKRLTVANELLAASSAWISMMEGDLWTATASLEASGARVAALEVTLGDAQKLLEVA
jgi:hypothetical protein